MKIFGLDFTSAPGPRKPITCAVCDLAADQLHVQSLLRLTSFIELESFLKRPGPWLAGFDFPFGQPRRLIENLGWPNSWQGYVSHVAGLTQQQFEEVIAAYRDSRPEGDKHHLRAVDEKANAISPMMLYGVPVGKMFYKGAPRLMRAGLNIIPCRPNTDTRTALEVYPALVARRWLDQRSYKSDTPQKQTAEREAARRDLIDCLHEAQLQTIYGVKLAFSDTDILDRLIEDASGDTLDAVLCAVQTAWAYLQGQNYGIPFEADTLEGWIADPALLS